MIQKHETLPDDALLSRYATAGCYTDCYSTDMEQRIDLESYVEAFYTTWLFKLERVILKWAVSRPSTDEDARRLAIGSANAFAAWSLEDRTDDQILMCDFRERTRSWFMLQTTDSGSRLYFGSAVVPKGVRARALTPLERRFTLLLGFHRLYSRALLRAAATRLRNRFST